MRAPLISHTPPLNASMYPDLRKQADLLQHRLRLEQFVAAVSTRLANLAMPDADRSVCEILAGIGQLTKTGRCYLFSLSEDLAVADNTHEWCAAAVKPLIDRLRNVPTSVYPWMLGQLRNGEPLLLASITALPAEAEAEHRLMLEGSVQSAILTPIRHAGILSGFIGCDDMHSERRWLEEDVRLLRIVGEQLINTLARLRTNEKLRASEELNRQTLQALSAHIAVIDRNEHKRTEAVLRFLGQCGAAASGESFFQELARFLGRTLEMEFVCIDRLENAHLSAQTLAVYHNGRFDDTVSYTLRDTPCGAVVGQKVCCFPRNVQALFPKDAMLRSLQAESFLGTTLWNAQGQLIGLIAVIGRKPLADTRMEESILQLVSVRAAAELERLQTEEALARLNAELEQRVKVRTAELAATNRELESFCYSVSHDLRAPLRSMDGFSQALLEDYGAKLDAVGQDFLNRIRANSQRMACLIDDLLHLSRLARAQMRQQTVNLTALAHAIISELHQADPERTVTVRIAPGLSATGDPVLLQAALTNLLQNAWKFTSQRPDAVIELGTVDDSRKTPADTHPNAAEECRGLDVHSESGVRRPASTPVFFVRDNGVGFDMRYADKLFTPFQRLHAITDFAGSGIGLATVQRIIHRHGGRVWFESAPGTGATFYFMIGEHTCA